MKAFQRYCCARKLVSIAMIGGPVFAILAATASGQEPQNPNVSDAVAREQNLQAAASYVPPQIVISPQTESGGNAPQSCGCLDLVLLVDVTNSMPIWGVRIPNWSTFSTWRTVPSGAGCVLGS